MRQDAFNQEAKGRLLMENHPLDHPAILSQIFYVRKTAPLAEPLDHVQDGWITVDADLRLGYRLYSHQKANSPLIVYFHGNGEIASDYEDISHFYHVAGASLLVVDYRGYGWSDGTPTLTSMLPDALAFFKALPQELARLGLEPESIFVKGRSLGSAPAVYLAYSVPEMMRGLIIESGYAGGPSLFRRLDIVIPDVLIADVSLPFNNAGKLTHVNLPLLVIHGEEDQIIPVSDGRELFESAPTAEKELVTVPGAGHNDLIGVATARYFDAVRRFIQRYG